MCCEKFREKTLSTSADLLANALHAMCFQIGVKTELTSMADDVAKGTRLRVYWTGEKRWYRGVITSSRVEEGRRIFQIAYDDGDLKWHDLSQEFWLRMSAEKKVASKPKAVAKPAAASRPASKSSHKASAAKPSDPDADDVATEVDSVHIATANTGSSSGGSTSRRVDGDGSHGATNGAASVAMPPPLISLSEDAIEVLPGGVVKIKNVVTAEVRMLARQPRSSHICTSFFERVAFQRARISLLPHPLRCVPRSEGGLCLSS